MNGIHMNMLFKSINALPPSSFTRRDGKADSIGASGSKFFVRESIWPALKVAIESQSPTFATP